VHLNGGDEALIRFFKKMRDTLSPGGVLVLEPQPWRSYRSALHKRDTRHVPFRNIEGLKLRPAGFVEYLIQKLGFVLLEDLRAKGGSKEQIQQLKQGKGFDRPIYILQRPAVVGKSRAAL
jgi:7SK snRNA methylphosphate capping enzyme